MSDTKALIISNKTIIGLSATALCALIGAAFMTGVYWEKVDRTTVALPGIEQKLGKIETKVASIEATLNFVVRRQVNVGIERAQP